MGTASALPFVEFYDEIMANYLKILIGYPEGQVRGMRSILSPSLGPSRQGRETKISFAGAFR